jgi:hypothetical protein
MLLLPPPRSSPSSQSAVPSVTSLQYGKVWSLMSVPVVKTMFVQILQHCVRLKWVVPLVWTVLRPAETLHIPFCSHRKKAKVVQVRKARTLSGVFWLAAALKVLQKSHILGLVCVAELPPQWTRSFRSCTSLAPNFVLWHALTLRLNESFCSCAVLKWSNAWAQCQFANPLGTGHSGSVHYFSLNICNKVMLTVVLRGLTLSNWWQITSVYCRGAQISGARHFGQQNIVHWRQIDYLWAVSMEI